MKKYRRLITYITIIVMTAVLLSACKKDSKNENPKTDSSDIEQDLDNPDGSNGEEVAKQDVSSNADSDTANVNGEETSNKDKKTGPSAMESMKAYQDFLNDRDELWFDMFDEEGKEGTPTWFSEDTYKYLAPGSAYTILSVAEGICNGAMDCYDLEDIKPERISYSYVDCGNDDVPELAIQLSNIGDTYFTDNIIIVVKLIDDKLQCIFSDEYGYRSYGTLNEYGIYSYGGSGGAAYYSEMYECIDGQGTNKFLFGCDTMSSAYYLSAPGRTDLGELAEKEGIADKIQIEQYYFDLYSNFEDNDKFLSSCDYIYYPMNDNYNRLEGDELKAVMKDGVYSKFWESTGLKLSTEEEVNKKIEEKLASAGVTMDMFNASEVDWIDLPQTLIEDMFCESNSEQETITLANPGWTYMYSGYEVEPQSRLVLEEKSKKANDIINEYDWFADRGISQPDRLDFCNGNYLFKLYGTDPDGLEWYPYKMQIIDTNLGTTLCTLDFSNYYTPDWIADGDEKYVEESIHWAVIDDDVLYVSTYHTTYATSAPHNGYITAFDMKNDFKVLWKSAPLVCNSNNFIVTEDSIICGYGFTAEDDYVYVLDKECGVQLSEHKVKTSPEWFHLDGENLYVRCYDTDYVFSARTI